MAVMTIGFEQELCVDTNERETDHQRHQVRETSIPLQVQPLTLLQTVIMAQVLDSTNV